MYDPFASPPDRSAPPVLGPDRQIFASLGDPLGQAVVAAWLDGPEEERPVLTHIDPKATPPASPARVEEDGRLVCDDPVAIARALRPPLFPDAAHDDLVAEMCDDLLAPTYRIGRVDEQGEYEEAYRALRATLLAWNERLSGTRFLRGDDTEDVSFADLLLVAYALRIDPVYYELHKLSAFLLRDLPELHAYVRDLWDLRPELPLSTDFDAIKSLHHRHAPVVNPKGIVPKGGIPNLDAPCFRAERFARANRRDATQEDVNKKRAKGEWVRPHSGERHWIRPDPDARYPAETGRYHIYAPYNCPWSHRALLGRGVLGLENVVGASVVYFRRHPEKGWQFNPRIPGCTEDRLHGSKYVVELYAKAGSDERSVPVLWDSVTSTIVSNESAEILRMLNGAFGDLAERDVDLYPEAHRTDIDQLNAMVYQRINNGAYKAGFAKSQHAYERAFDRYFAALDFLEALLDGRRWLVGSESLTEADLRLFPTVFRHDAVYYSRFRLDLRRIADYPRLSAWLERMLEVPGVAASSDMDHARNGYFGRTGNEIVPAGPIPLGLSRSQFTREVWLNE